MKVIHIYEDEEHTLIETVEEVLKQLEKGYVEGVHPTFNIEEVEE